MFVVLFDLHQPISTRACGSGRLYAEGELFLSHTDMLVRHNYKIIIAFALSWRWFQTPLKPFFSCSQFKQNTHAHNQHLLARKLSDAWKEPFEIEIYKYNFVVEHKWFLKSLLGN